MRLVNVHTLKLDDFASEKVPPYAIASHRWEEDEITLQELQGTDHREKAGYKKVQGFADYVKEKIPAIQWIWIDTCCIDKQNPQELSEAINSMFQWYHDAAVCLAYLSDVPLSEDRRAFDASIWFRRGWTLQELIAPQVVVFLSYSWQVIGYKGSEDQGSRSSILDKGPLLNKSIASITGVEETVLQDYGQCRALSTEEKLKWMDRRDTTYEEDRWYCLLGLFEISMTIRYGALERGDTTKRRFLAKVKKAALTMGKSAQAEGGSTRGWPLASWSKVVDTLMLETPSTSTALPSNMPFARDPDFIDRKSLSEQIIARLALPAGRIALVGLGGVGKSQLAIESSYRIRERAPQTWTFWIHASNTARFEQSVRDIADLVELDGREDPSADIFTLLRNWLRSRVSQRWVVVLDNADDADFLVKSTPASGRRFFDCLPLCDHGSVLITTRSEDAALRLVERRNIIAIYPMDVEDAVTLLRRKLGSGAEGQELRELASALEYMPLAITQAAAYICQMRGRYSVRQYVDKLRKSNQSKGSVLDNDAGDLRRDPDAQNSIILTWQISFEHIYRIRPSAAALLSLMSFCDRQAIPELLLRVRRNGQNAYSQTDGRGRVYLDNDEHSESGEVQSDHNDPDESDETSSLDSDRDSFDSDTAMLEGFSFVSTMADASTLEMHRLVQLSTQKWLAGKGQLERWKERYVSNLLAVFPAGHYKNWSVCQTLLPHARAASFMKLQGQAALLEWASVMYLASWYTGARGAFADAEEMARRCVKVRRRELGEEHPSTLTSMGNLASTYRNQGRWTEAEELEVKVMETRRTVLGEAHPDTLTSMNNLASTYWNQGRWAEAEELEVKVMETRRTVLGEAHPDTLTSMGNHASTYRNQGRWAEAEELEVKVMETRRTVLGEAHPGTLTSMGNLASTYRNQGRWTEAEELFVKVMETSRTVLGEAHPDTLTNMNNLASTYGNQGRWAEAEELEVKVMETRRTVLGEAHPGTLTSMSNLASTYWNKGRWAEAEELFVKVMETRRTVLGEAHPDTLTSIANLAVTYLNQKRLQEAQDLMTRCFEARRRILGKTHPKTQKSMSWLVEISTRIEQISRD
nr:vegetative incompatibility protein het-e-1 [Quercus suber]